MLTLLAFGDSHLEALKYASDLGLLIAEESHFCIVPGATAVGLRNPNSKTNALAIFLAFARKHQTSSRVLVHLGEVDCGFVVWWRQQKYGDSVAIQIEESLSSYKKFILDLKECGFDKICITGTSLPTIRDGIDFGAVANLRREVQVSLLDRTRLTIQYNAALFEMAADVGCSFFDISKAVLNPQHGIVSDYFRNPNPQDHHLDKEKVVGIWADACNNFLQNG